MGLMQGLRTYADRRPYVLPVSLEDLAGPDSGLVRLPAALGWTGRRCYDLDESSDARVLYERVIVEAFDVDVVVRVLDAARLLAAWPHLYLPAQAKRLWEERFPELVSSHRAAG
jgi:hypothetical protein